MFQRYDKLKRLVCLLSVVLALASSFQQVHFFCALAGCVPTFASNGQEQATCTKHVCPHSKACDKEGAMAASRLHDCSERDPDGSGPIPSQCPPTCWCHQLPADPFEFPRSAPKPIEILVLSAAYMDAALFDVSQAVQLSRNATILALDASAKTAPQVCAYLCRYLT